MRTRLLVTVCAVAALASGCTEDGPTVTPPSAAATSNPSAADGSTGAAPTPEPTGAPTASSTPSAAGSQPNVAGSRWSGTTSLGKTMTLYLKSDGQFEYTSNGQSRDQTPGNDPWTQTGTTLVLKTNDSYATYTGVVDGDRYTGTARNVTGKTWTFSFTRSN